MSAKTVTGDEGTGREAALRAMQEAAESAAGKKGVPKGPQGTKGIVVLSNDTSWSPRRLPFVLACAARDKKKIEAKTSGGELVVLFACAHE